LKRYGAVCAALCIAALLSGCGEAPKPPVTHDADIQAIKDIEAQWNKDYAARDVDKLVAHYADGAVLMTPGAPPSAGTDAIRTALQQMVADSTLSLRFEATRVEVAKSGDMAYTLGTYGMTMTPPGKKKPITDKGGYVTVYEKQADGTWKAVSDIATSSMPMAPPPAASEKKTHRAAKHRRA